MASPAERSRLQNIKNIDQEIISFNVVSSIYSGNDSKEEASQQIRVVGKLGIKTAPQEDSTFPSKMARIFKFSSLNFVNEVSRHGTVPYQLLYTRLVCDCNNRSSDGRLTQQSTSHSLNSNSLSWADQSMWGFKFRMWPLQNGGSGTNLFDVVSMATFTYPTHHRPFNSDVIIISYWAKFEPKKKKKWLPKSFQKLLNRPAAHSDLINVIHLSRTPSARPSRDFFNYNAQLEVRDGSTKSERCQGIAPHERVKIQTSTADDIRKIKIDNLDLIPFYMLYEDIKHVGLFDAYD